MVGCKTANADQIILHGVDGCPLGLIINHMSGGIYIMIMQFSSITNLQ